MNLSKKIKTTIIETKEKQEKLLIEETLVNKRIMMIVEDVNNIKDFNNLPKQKQLKLGFTLLEEFSYLQNNDLINEGFIDTLKTLFGSSFEGIAQTIAEPILGNILSGIGFKDGFMRKSITSFLTSRPSELVHAFNNCDTMTRLISQAFVKSTVMMLQQETKMDGMMNNFVRNSVLSSLEGSGLSKELESEIEPRVCELFNKYTSNVENILDKIKGDKLSTKDSSEDKADLIDRLKRKLSNG